MNSCLTKLHNARLLLSFIKPMLVSTKTFDGSRDTRHHTVLLNCYQFYSKTIEKPRRSPYAVLKLRTSATTDEIKQSFRKLAKLYHPDLNTNKPAYESEKRMSELIEAYDQLLSDEFGKKVGDSRVALACEMYTLEELKMDRLHDVYTLKIIYTEDPEGDEIDNDVIQTQNVAKNDELVESDETQLNTEVIIEVLTHPDNSVSDLKRYLQDRFGNDWGLTGRKLDRHGVGTGWELMDVNGNILGSWFFLNSYNIRDNSIAYAVVRKYDT